MAVQVMPSLRALAWGRWGLGTTGATLAKLCAGRAASPLEGLLPHLDKDAARAC